MGKKGSFYSKIRTFGDGVTGMYGKQANQVIKRMLFIGSGKNCSAGKRLVFPLIGRPERALFDEIRRIGKYW